MAKPLSRAERIELGVRALRMSARGASNLQIAEQIGISSKTVGKLIQETARELFDADDRERLRVEVLQSISEVKLRAWTELDRRKESTPAQKRANLPGDRIVGPTVRTLPKLLEVIGRSDDRLVRLLGLAEPEEVNVNHRTPAERIQAFEEWRRSKGRPPLTAVEGGRSDPVTPAPAQDPSPSGREEGGGDGHTSR